MADYTKLVVGALATAAGLSVLDAQLMLSSDLKWFPILIPFQKKIKAALNAPQFSIADVWAVTCANNRKKTALISVDTGAKLTFDEVDRRSNQVAVWARKCGFGKRDVVALFMENKPEFIITWLGFCKAGVVVAMINTSNKKKPLLHSIAVANCKALIFGTELTEAVEGVLEELKAQKLPLIAEGPGTPAWARAMETELKGIPDGPINAKEYREGINANDAFAYIYTSGTTGLPKACVIKNIRYHIMSNMIGSVFGGSSNDILYTVLPLYHSAGGCLGAGSFFALGMTMVLRRKFSTTAFWADCAKYNATVTQYIGELARYLLNAPPSEFDRKHKVRLAVGNGLRREVWAPFQKRFNVAEIGEFYGATEGNVSFMNHSKNFEGVGAVGRAGWLYKKIQGWEIVAHDVATEMPVRDPKTGFCLPCPQGVAGELLGKIKPGDALSAFEGYTNKEATAKKVLKDVLVKGDSYFRTGDLLRHDKNGYIYFVDRIGDTFRWKGENVSTNEVGEIVSVFPGILEANIYGVVVPGNEDGRACMAAVVTEGGKELDMVALAKHLTANLASYALPLFVRLLPEMESTGTFKQRKVTFVQEGINPSVVKDKMWVFNDKTKAYDVLDQAAYNSLIQLKSKL